MKTAWIQCKHKGYVLNIIVPATSNKYKFHRGRPNLIKVKEDIEFFEKNDYYEEVKSPNVVTDKVEKVEEKLDEEVPEGEAPKNPDVESVPDDSTGQDSDDEPELKKYSKKELKKMKKSKLIEVLSKLTTKECPNKLVDARKLILELQGSK